MTIRVSLLALLLAAAPLDAVADVAALPDAATIRKNHLAAVGTEPDSYRETFVIQTGGSTAVPANKTFIRRGDDFVETVRTTAGRTVSGRYHGDRWFQNKNGHTVIVGSDPPGAERERVTETVSRVSTPIDAFVIARRNAAGYGTREFYDPATWYLVRRETTAADGLEVETFDTFKAFGSQHLAAHEHDHDETTQTDSDITISDYSEGDIGDDEVKIAPNRRQVVEFPAAASKVKLPAIFLDNGHIVLPVRIGERTYDFLLDTGAAGIFIDPAVAAEAHLRVLDRSSNAVNAGRIDTGTVLVPELRVGDLTLHGVYTDLAPNGRREDHATRIVGLLGFDFICELGITIDYEHKTVTAARFGAYGPPAVPHVTLPTRLGDETPLVSVTINGKVADRMTLDTGATSAVLIFNYFVRRHPEAVVDHNDIGANEGDAELNGIGGRIDTRPYAFENFTIGNITFHDFIGYLVTSKSYGFDEDGVIGAEFLQFFDVTLDYPNGMIYLVPNETAKSMNGRR